VMAQTTDAGWQGALITGAATALMLFTKINPLWFLAMALEGKADTDQQRLTNLDL
jgi:hypothetical protein